MYFNTIIAGCRELNPRWKSVRDLHFWWLPMKERRNFHLLKLIYKALNYETYPSYLKISEVIHTCPLRSNVAKRLVIPLDKSTFQDSAAKLFNSLHIDMRNSDNLNYF